MLDLRNLDAAIRYEGGMSRRLFLAYASALSTIPLWNSRVEAADRKGSFKDNPFTLGVASGDPDSQSVVLWTRLAPKVEEADGGMKPEIVDVTWELGDDAEMKKVLQSGKTVATPQLGHSVHVTVEGLKADRWYFYRFKAGDFVSPVGKTRVLPAADVATDKLRFAFVSCQHYEQGLFTAYEQMAKDELDLVFHLGDYIYEYPGTKKQLVRKHSGPANGKIKTLDDYRLRHAQYRSDKLLQGMHAQCPWFVTWDDHEVDNNYANDITEFVNKKAGAPPAEFLLQRANAYQAYYEMMPLRKRSLPHGPDMTIYRKASFGNLAEFFILDTRQYRTDQPNEDGAKPLNAAALDPKNSLLGQKQRAWLDASLLASEGTWNVLAQQVMMGMVSFRTKGDDDPKFSMDQWPGAAHERKALVEFMRTRKIPNPVVLTGDIHSNWVNDLRVDDLKPETPVIATEFVGTSISSGGNGPQTIKDLDTFMAANPCIKFHNRERGYVRCVVTPTTWTSDYVVVEDVLKEGGKVLTRQSFVVEAGTPGAKKA
jgi:alkaline phosphatase D